LLPLIVDLFTAGSNHPVVLAISEPPAESNQQQLSWKIYHLGKQGCGPRDL
jgi:hypothetical protein